MSIKIKNIFIIQNVQTNSYCQISRKTIVQPNYNGINLETKFGFRRINKKYWCYCREKPAKGVTNNFITS